MTDHQCAMPRLETAAQLEPEDPLVWLDRASFCERNELLEWAVYAKHTTGQVAGGRNAIKDAKGFWIFEGTTLSRTKEEAPCRVSLE